MKMIITLWHGGPFIIERLTPQSIVHNNSQVLELPDKLANELLERQQAAEKFQDELLNLFTSEYVIKSP